MKRRYFIFLILFLGGMILNADTKSTEQQLLKMSLRDLMNIEVSTTSKIKEDIKETPASVVIITREDIKKYGFKSVADILQNIPGFYMINDYYWLGSENFGVRGFFSPGVFNDVVILVNGVNQIGAFYSDYSLLKINIPVEAIDRVEVVRGPMSIMYGSNAFLGAVNIITNKERVSEISASYGTSKYHKLFVRLSKENKDFSFTINTGFYGDDGIDFALSDFTDNYNFLKNVGLAKNDRTKGELKKANRYFNFSGKYKNFSFDFTYSDGRKGVFDGLPSYPPGTFINNRSTILFLKYKNQVLRNLFFTGKFTYQANSFYWEYEILKENSYATNYKNSLQDEIEFNLSYIPDKKFNMIFGFVRNNVFYTYETYDYPIFPIQYTNTEISSPDNIISNALFTQLNYKMNNKLKIIAGLRLERLNKYRIFIQQASETPAIIQDEGEYNNEKIKVIPRLAIIYSPLKNHSIKFLYGKAIKNPSFTQNLTQIYTYQPTLLPAYIETFELNYILSPSSDIFATISLYKNNINNLIVKRNIYNSQTQTWELHSTNSGKMETKGIEIGLKLLPIKTLSISLNGAFQKTKNLEKGFENVSPAYAPNFLGYLKIDYSLKNFSLALMGRYVGKMRTMWEKTSDSSEGSRIGNTIDPYYTFDINFRVDNLFNKNFFLNLHIYNLLNKEIRFPTTPGNSWAEKGTLDYGRTVILSIGRYF